ncbi:sprouty-related, EVH1 domain-containing protein 1 isoform X1 [Neodiprion pinetum]|uniref:Sprouty-related, EVH1 domain-containing protein 1 isoform X1 n=1 Tax=Neodiprion lecontei TaxID=441921 RepID=A0A6J0BBP9_NEOLC|nr:sprouty-related, EVH1 domain-containing protein 1 isoform X1 [Neodiprion lecontei]XP_046428819.1 sprouty-related, EVH1 domain-containing protein 1 isoform X1 [Neodiprion fabricii]XP_046484923.1 sprouty-related, EVH1 domain-containing protein 1 isoform X1 [Neodiprion pinetum]XP_046622665.1 sprouty-related, EVH1 domain-containing protein 1 isoform X1 [Neodiprion virginianus]
MTEASEDGNYLVRVRAQVMTRDDSSGGWVPLGGGGLSNVSVRRRSPSTAGGHPNVGIASPGIPSAASSTAVPTTSTSGTAHPGVVPNLGSTSHDSTTTSPPGATDGKHEYLIYGKRISDQTVVLSCTIKKDFEYNKVMPTFHHWRTGEKKFGLTFQTAADARAFDKGVRTAVEELLEGLAESSLYCGQSDVGDDDVFMTLNLPVDPVDPRPSSETQRGAVRKLNHHHHHSQCPDFSLDPHKAPPIHYIGGPSAKPLPPPHHPLESMDVSTDNYPYVQLTTLNHEYQYPVIEDHKGGRFDRRGSSSSLKKPDVIVSQMAKSCGKRNSSVRLRCKHCQELYSEQHNPRGACEYAPDPVRRGIATVSCLSCAQCMLYHCMSDAEGDFAQNPCSCSTEEGCGRRWFGLALLSMIVPCLWFYPPLRAVHWCGMSCGLCGGRHYPME